jgi:hypothetical protein
MAATRLPEAVGMRQSGRLQSGNCCLLIPAAEGQRWLGKWLRHHPLRLYSGERATLALQATDGDGGQRGLIAWRRGAQIPPGSNMPLHRGGHCGTAIPAEPAGPQRLVLVVRAASQIARGQLIQQRADVRYQRRHNPGTIIPLWLRLSGGLQRGCQLTPPFAALICPAVCAKQLDELINHSATFHLHWELLKHPLQGHCPGKRGGVPVAAPPSWSICHLPSD